MPDIEASSKCWAPFRTWRSAWKQNSYRPSPRKFHCRGYVGSKRYKNITSVMPTERLRKRGHRWRASHLSSSVGLTTSLPILIGEGYRSGWLLISYKGTFCDKGLSHQFDWKCASSCHLTLLYRCSCCPILTFVYNEQQNSLLLVLLDNCRFQEAVFHGIV